MKYLFFAILVFPVLAIAQTASEFYSDVDTAYTHYTDLDTETDCEWSEQVEESGQAVCAGLEGYPIYIVHGERSLFVGFGDVPAYVSSPGGINLFRGIGDVVEWRLLGEKPYATILRWLLGALDENGEYVIHHELLVISTIGDPDGVRQSCQVAYIDARANAEPNELARQVAHLAARNFRCGVDVPIYIGLGGVSVNTLEQR